jgi:hypothetical protein
MLGGERREKIRKLAGTSLLLVESSVRKRQGK